MKKTDNYLIAIQLALGLEGWTLDELKAKLSLVILVLQFILIFVKIITGLVNKMKEKNVGKMLNAFNDAIADLNELDKLVIERTKKNEIK